MNRPHFTRHVSYSTAITDAVLFPSSDLKQQLNLPSTGTSDDTWLAEAAAAARSLIERSIPGGFAVRLQSKQLSLYAFPSSGYGEIELPFPPLSSVTGISYYDGTNSTQGLASSDYRVLNRGVGMRSSLFPLIDDVWPVTRSRPDAVTISFDCGSTCSTDVPPTIRQAVKMLVTHWYENRGVTMPGALSGEMQEGLESLLASNGYGFYG